MYQELLWAPDNQPPEKETRALPVVLMQPQALAFLDPQQEALLGLGNFEINTSLCLFHSVFQKAQQYLHGQCPSSMALCPIYLSPHSGTMAKPPCHQQELHLPGPSSHLWADRFSGLSSCVGLTSPTQLPTACSALQYNTAFKQRPHHPHVNHLALYLTPNTMDWGQLTTFST